MILKILNYINNGGCFSTKNISKDLGIDEFMVEKYKEQLIKQQYIIKQQDSNCCGGSGCKTCSCGCSSKNLNAIVQWEITEKGKELIKRNN